MGTVVLRIKVGSGWRTVPGIAHNGASTLERKELLAVLHERDIVSGNDGEVYEVLPKLSAVWDTVGSMQLVTAEALLQRKATEFERSGQRELELLSIKIPSALALTVGPAVLLLLLLYLQAHVVHLTSVISQDGAELAAFPWIVLFDAAIAVWMTRASIFVLPAVAGAWIIWLSEWSPGMKGIAVGIFVGVVEVIGVVIFRRLRRIRQIATEQRAARAA
jgi:hypothetical protein